ncbi:hypothetical protein PENSPDRAFT_659058 [Peniophora sp. CONT]|nr:hypothetical protein PENSPDRAFT_659058 [Peniophora sp. CONT]
MTEVFPGLSMHPAPRLRELDISIDDEVDTDRPPIVLPESLFASRKLTSLESVTIASCEMTPSWSKTFLTRSLRSLKLDNGVAWRNIDEMMQFFELVPFLETLDLHTYNVRVHSFDTTRSNEFTLKGVLLRKLRTFRVCTRFLEDMAMFAYLMFPHTAELDIHIAEGDTDLEGDAGEDEILDAICAGLVTLKNHFAPAVAAGLGYTHVRLSPWGINVPCYSPCVLHDNGGMKNTSAAQLPAGLAPISLPFGISKLDPHLLRLSYAMLLEQPILYTATAVCIQGILPPEAYSCLEKWTAVEALEVPKFHKSALPGFVAGVTRQPFRLFPSLRRLQVVDATIVEPDEPLDEALIPWDKVVEGEGLRGTDARAFIATVKKLADYEHFERLIFIRCVMSAQVLQEVKGILGEQRVEGKVESPEERLQAREEWKRKRSDKKNPHRFLMPSRWEDD